MSCDAGLCPDPCNRVGRLHSSHVGRAVWAGLGCAATWTQAEAAKVGCIPARYASTRFPGKALVPIAGVPMVLRTYRQARKATQLDALIVATDDERIRDLCEAQGAAVVMTSADCANGTERCEEAVQKLPGQYDIVVNIQGDEPLIEPEVIDAVVQALKDAPEAVYSTACTPLGLDSVPHTSRVKCVTDLHGNALYFSRGVLPCNKDGCARSYPVPFEQLPYLLHMGLQCYDRHFLSVYCSLPATPLMAMEDLEQLKVLEHGYKMRVVVMDAVAHGVDVPQDVEAIEAIMRERGIQ